MRAELALLADRADPLSLRLDEHPTPFGLRDWGRAFVMI